MATRAVIVSKIAWKIEAKNAEMPAEDDVPESVDDAALKAPPAPSVRLPVIARLVAVALPIRVLPESVVEARVALDVAERVPVIAEPTVAFALVTVPLTFEVEALVVDAYSVSE